MFRTYPRRVSAFRDVRNTNTIDSIIASVCCDIDATLSASYGGSGQTWANMISSPSDGAAQADYDLFLGADGSSDTDDPSFVGIANDPAALFDYDGGDFNVTKVAAASHPPTYKNAHKTTGGGDATFAMVMKTGDSDPGNNGLFGNASGGVDNGLFIQITGAGALRFSQCNGSSCVGTGDLTTLSANTLHLIVMAYESNTGNVRFWVNNKTKSTSSLTPGTTTTDPGSKWSIAAIESVIVLKAGSHVIHYSVYDDFLDDADVGDLVDLLESRHNRAGVYGG